MLLDVVLVLLLVVSPVNKSDLDIKNHLRSVFSRFFFDFAIVFRGLNIFAETVIICSL